MYKFIMHYLLVCMGEQIHVYTLASCARVERGCGVLGVGVKLQFSFRGHPHRNLLNLAGCTQNQIRPAKNLFAPQMWNPTQKGRMCRGWEEEVESLQNYLNYDMMKWEIGRPDAITSPGITTPVMQR